MRRRLDAELVRRGIAASRSEAKLLIEAGNVRVGGVVAEKVARMTDGAEPIVVAGPARTFVGRGGDKLNGALEAFNLDPTGLNVLDVGASTGGFTDCLLQRGATEVTALDVGYGQLHERLQADSRVVVLERTNLRHVDPTTFGPFDAAVGDLSFISLRTVFDPLLRLVRPGGWLVLLVKPQFEAGRAEVQKGRGIITDPAIWGRTLREVLNSAIEHAATPREAIPSPITGAHGNVEFLIHLEIASGHSDVGANASVDEIVDRAVDAAIATHAQHEADAALDADPALDADSGSALDADSGSALDAAGEPS